jgi:hypothetical protein
MPELREKAGTVKARAGVEFQQAQGKVQEQKAPPKSEAPEHREA